MARLNHARDVLTDNNQRRAYDDWRNVNKTHGSTYGSGSGNTASHKHASTNKNNDLDGYGDDWKNQVPPRSKVTRTARASAAELALDSLRQKWCRALETRDFEKAEWETLERAVQDARHERDADAHFRDQKERGSYGWREANYEVEERNRTLFVAKEDAELAKGVLDVAEQRLEEAARAWHAAAPGV